MDHILTYEKAAKAVIDWVGGDWLNANRDGIEQFLLDNFEKELRADLEDYIEDCYGSSKRHNKKVMFPAHVSAFTDQVITDIAFNYVVDIESIKPEIQDGNGDKFLDREDLFSTIDSLSKLAIALGTPYSKTRYKTKENK